LPEYTPNFLELSLKLKLGSGIIVVGATTEGRVKKRG